jgi:three-Cys-motif partner protein
MPTEDINTKPFDDETILKLDIFERYLEEWLPVFIQLRNCSRVLVCDFFAGSGSDIQGNPGSPLRILRTVEKFQEQIVLSKTHIRVIFNDLQSEKTAKLEALISTEGEVVKRKTDGLVTVECHNDEFQKLFHERERDFSKQPNLIFLDQYGVKEVNSSVFEKLIDLEKTDFLFFVSSSYLRRFPDEDCFRVHFPDLDPNLLRNSRYEDVHRKILEYFSGKIPTNNQTRLYPFSIKKGPNIYGLIFGSKHPLGVEKFLNIAWDKNKLNGEANFDIDGDIDKQQPELFPELHRPTKLEKFEQEVNKMICRKREVTNRESFDFALANGHTPSQIRDIVQKLRKAGEVSCDGRIGFSYKTCYKDNNIKIIKAVNSG